MFSLSVVQLPRLQMGILNDGAGDEVPTKVLLAEATLTAFVIGLSYCIYSHQGGVVIQGSGSAIHSGGCGIDGQISKELPAPLQPGYSL